MSYASLPPFLPRYCIGLTGGIGSGKTTVANLFADLGAGIVDADLIAHQLTGPDGVAMAAIRQQFGGAAVTADNALNRRWMREQAFTDPACRERLESILHPLIRSTMHAQIADNAAPYVLLVIPLLLEKSGWRELVARILVIDIAPQLQIERVSQRNGLPPKQIEAIMATQSSRLTKLALADDILCNDLEQSNLPGKVALLHRAYLALAASNEYASQKK